MNLVLQGSTDPEPSLPALAELYPGGEWRRLTPTAWRLDGASPHPILPEFCTSYRLDWAYVPPQRRLSDFGLVAFDMDSTLIATETLDDLAELAGVGEEVSRLTALSMAGEIDFAASFRQRVALLAGLGESALDQVYADRVRPNPGARTLLAELKKRGVKTLLATGGFDYFAHRLQADLGLDFVACNTLEIHRGKLTGRLAEPLLDAAGKAKALAETCQELGLSVSQSAAVGDGANDLAMLQAAGVGIAFRAGAVLKKHADHALDHAGLDGVLPLMG